MPPFIMKTMLDYQASFSSSMLFFIRGRLLDGQASVDLSLLER